MLFSSGNLMQVSLLVINYLSSGLLPARRKKKIYSLQSARGGIKIARIRPHLATLLSLTLLLSGGVASNEGRIRGPARTLDAVRSETRGRLATLFFAHLLPDRIAGVSRRD